MAKRTPLKPRTFESTGKKGDKNDTYIRVFFSMMHSPAFTKLTEKQKVLYFYCKEKFVGYRKPGADYPDMPSLQSDDLFYLTFADVKGILYKSTSQKNFRLDMNALVKFGFIEIVAAGKGGRKTIYRYSSNWKNMV